MWFNLVAVTLNTLAELLEHRLIVIANHDLRTRNPAEQLRQLQEVSEAIVGAHAELSSQIDARLNHYLSQASYDKALAHIRAGNEKAGEGDTLAGQ